MDWQKYILIGGMAIVSYLLVLEWNEFQNEKLAVKTAAIQQQLKQQQPTTVDLPADIPSETENTTQSDLPSIGNTAQAPEAKPSSKQLIHIKTDTLSIDIDPKGGDIVTAALLNHYAELNKPELPFVILNKNAQQTYIAQSGLLGVNATDTASGRPLFSSIANNYQIAETSDELVVDLFFQQGLVQITKRFTFTRGDNLINIQYLIQNNSSANWKANFYAQIKRDNSPVSVSSSAIGLQPYLGAALTTKEKNYKKIDFDDLDEESFTETIKGGWVAMVQHYFISAWIADKNVDNKFTLRKLPAQNMYTFGYVAPQTLVEPGQEGVINSQFYVGAKDVYRLEEVAPYIDLTVDYGWLWWIAKPIFWLLTTIQSIVINWGWSIIVLTLCIKGIFFWFTAKSYRSMAKMRAIQPKMQQLKDQFGDDRQKMGQETMKLYQKEGVNPMSGCWPILIQMPVFISLYWVLSESVELRHAPWILWIEDLSVKDPYFILPLIMGATQYVMMKLNPTPPDPMQAKIMQLMPIMFTFLFMWFPAGLVLYWTINNTVSMIQQYLITKQIEAATA